jgi:hypothetical protein
MSNAVAKIDEAPVVQADAATIMAVISRAASDPNCDVERMERLMAMHERHEARNAAAAFAAALADMQTELPSIGERGNAANRYTYALWEDVNAAIKPVLSKHGFALSFRVDCSNGITVTGVLSHKSGHREETSITLPADASGNKNAVQAVASSVSYGKRYTAGALLNLTSHGEDDDAFAAAVALIDDEQAAKIREWIAAVEADEKKFIRYLASLSKRSKIERIEDLPASLYEDAIRALRAKQKAQPE